MCRCVFTYTYTHGDSTRMLVLFFFNNAQSFKI